MKAVAVTVDSPAFTDNAGNTRRPAPRAQSFKIDLSDPTDVAFVGGPAADDSYYFGSVPAAPTCTATDAVSGLASCQVTGYSSLGGDAHLDRDRHRQCWPDHHRQPRPTR